MHSLGAEDRDSLASNTGTIFQHTRQSLWQFGTKLAMGFESLSMLKYGYYLQKAHMTDETKITLGKQYFTKNSGSVYEFYLSGEIEEASEYSVHAVVLEV